MGRHAILPGGGGTSRVIYFELTEDLATGDKFADAKIEVDLGFGEIDTTLIVVENAPTSEGHAYLFSGENGVFGIAMYDRAKSLGEEEDEEGTEAKVGEGIYRIINMECAEPVVA